MSQPAFDIHFRTGDGNGLWALALAFFPVQGAVPQALAILASN